MQSSKEVGMPVFTPVDYVWIGGNGELRSKTRIIYDKVGVSELGKIEKWNYDGSSTNQAMGESSEVFLHPRRLFRCPFRKMVGGLIVMCDTYDALDAPAKYNNRSNAATIFNKYLDEKPWYGLEQEYFIYDRKTNLPLGFNPAGKQGQYYCSVGGNNAFGRDMMDEHMLACIYAGIQISGTNLEVAPAQCEFQVGPVEGIDAADQLWVARYILERISEKYGTYIVYHPKPLEGDWNGSGMHCNFSTQSMRNKGGLKIIYESMPKLAEKHISHMKVYGEHNEKRMTGLHETSSCDTFTWGVANRKCSVRIPTDTFRNGFGYMEERRSSSNCDPYLVTAKILETVME